MSIELLGEASVAVRAVTLMIAAGQFVFALQLLATRSLFEPGGLLDWDVCLRHWRRRRNWLPELGAPSVVAVAGIQATSAGAAALAALQGWPLTVPLAVLFIINVFHIFRMPLGRTGAEDMSHSVILALLIGSLGSSTGMTFALIFIAMHSCLAYLTAGAAKLIMPEWRDGSYMRGMICTRYWGNRALAAWMLRRPVLIKACALTVFIGEMVFPLIVIAPWPLAITGLAVAAAFHIAVAVILGLNLFLFAFVATYPAVLFLNLMVRGRLL